MKKIFYFVFAALLFAACSDDNNGDDPKTPVTVNFQNAELGADGYLWGKPQATENSDTGWMEFDGMIYKEFNASFSSYYSDFGYNLDTWCKFAISEKHDKVTEGMSNQFSVYTERNEDDNKFAVAYDMKDMGPGYSYSPRIDFDTPVTLTAMHMANAAWTYLYLSKKYSDYSVDVIGLDGDTETGRVHVALASGNTVVANWKGVDLAPLGVVTSVVFSVSCEDQMAPTYFCIDNLTFVK